MAVMVTVIIAAALAAVLAGGGPAGAQSAQAITDYTTFPQPLPAGCPDGPAALLDVRASTTAAVEAAPTCGPSTCAPVTRSR
jgi:hypothetical protein